MSRSEIEIPSNLHDLSILDEEGAIDKDLTPDLSEEQMLRMHRAMLLSRLLDERMLRLQRDGRLGTFAPVKGQEASQIGAVAALSESDYMVPAFRETAAFVWRGIPLDGLFLYNGGYNEGGEIPEGQNDLPVSIPVASQLPIAVGLGYAAKYRKDERVALVFFGDGATSEGDFHEALNFAGVFQTPVVFVCQNNQWAISHPVERQSASATLVQKAIAYDMPGLRVDGNDIFAVYAGVREGVERARSGKGPTLVECITYRMEVHTTADDPTKYRDRKEVEKWKKRDPIRRFQNYLASRDLLSPKDLESLTKELEEEIDGAWASAKKKMDELGNPLDMFDHVYAGPSPSLEKQRESLAKRIEGNGNG